MLRASRLVVVPKEYGGQDFYYRPTLFDPETDYSIFLKDRLSKDEFKDVETHIVSIMERGFFMRFRSAVENAHALDKKAVRKNWLELVQTELEKRYNHASHPAPSGGQVKKSPRWCCISASIISYCFILLLCHVCRCIVRETKVLWIMWTCTSALP